ncbi:hypothetical protein CYMTET_24491 [Cymbomonas tetramitiformis]|uniref:Uncharacterized protein n=1 Tax=Cymbomonas tetramitiformis TaxID=36881 RepID=A0AAE0FWH5_9CHLO|nr:hypothetical protein CYMTET_27481 [Cymbomonas tetramitiformis]KAK3266918.1 hypothetical protein CYMTET_24491 [Cymbomonas tetramitiformis]
MAAEWQLSESAKVCANLLKRNAASLTAGVQDTPQWKRVLSDPSMFPPHSLSGQTFASYSTNCFDPADSFSYEINYNPESRINLFDRLSSTTMRLPSESPPAFSNDAPMERHNSAPLPGEEAQNRQFHSPPSFVNNTVDIPVRCPSGLLELPTRTAEACSDFNHFLSQWTPSCDTGVTRGPSCNDGKDTSITNQEVFDEVPNNISAAEIPLRFSKHEIVKRARSNTLSVLCLAIHKLLLPTEIAEEYTVKAARLSGRTNRVPERTVIHESFQRIWKFEGKHAAAFQKILPEYEDLFSSGDGAVTSVVDQNDKRNFMIKQLKSGWSSWPLFKQFENFEVSDFEVRSFTEEKAQLHWQTNGEELNIYDITYDDSTWEVSDREENSASVCKSMADLKDILSFLIIWTQKFLDITGKTAHTNVHYVEDLWPTCCNKLVQGFVDELDDVITYYDAMKRPCHGK